MSDPLPPAFIRAVRQNGHNADCGVATIATLAGVNYEEALAAAVQVQPEVLDLGLTWTEIRRTLDRLGIDCELRAVGKYDLDEDTGILNVRKRGEDHVVFLWAGRVIEGNHEGWLDPVDYLTHYRYKAHSLLVRVG